MDFVIWNLIIISPMPLLPQTTLNLQKILPPPPCETKLVLALSGGSDSMCLLHLLQKLQPKFKFKLILAHFNHQTRGKTSDSDQKFVEKQAKKHNLPLFTKIQNVPQYAKKHKLNLEAAGRLLRYQFLEKIRVQEKADFILTAHHFNDNLETIILNLTRGCSLNGLAGFPLKSGNLLRPLYNIPKTEIENYLKKHHILYRLDQTNLDTRFKRNFIRLKLIPLLKKNQPNFLKTALQNLENFQALNQFFTQKSEKWIHQKVTLESKTEWHFPLTPWLKQPPFLQLEILRHLYLKRYQNNFNLTRAHLLEWQTLLKQNHTGKIKRFGSKFWLQINYGRALISAKSVLSPNRPKTRLTPLPIPGQTTFNHWKITTRLLKKPPTNLKKSPNLYLNYPHTKPPPISIRTWQKGDRFNPLGLNGSQKLHDFFINRKITQENRAQTPIFINGKKEILAVGSLMINEKHKITPQSKKILEIQLSPLANYP